MVDDVEEPETDEETPTDKKDDETPKPPPGSYRNRLGKKVETRVGGPSPKEERS